MKRFVLFRTLGILAGTLALFSLSLVAWAAGEHQVNFASTDPVMELSGVLTPYHGPTAGGCTDWHMLTALNDSDRAATRVLLAGHTPGTGLSLITPATRPQIAAVASSDDKVYVDRLAAYGRRAYRVTLPPASLSQLAICTVNTGQPPSILAWTEPALSQHNRNLAIFLAAVAGLIGAAALIVGGLAAMSGHAAPRWAAITLLLVLLERLSATGMFDASLVTPNGGPYGLMALIACLALACGALLTDAVVPLIEIWPRFRGAFRVVVVGLVVLGVLAFAGIPATVDASDAVVVLGTALIAAYLVHRGREGSLAARVLAPSAAVFALVTFVAAVTTLGGFGENLVAGDAAGGFAAAGAILLALAVAADEGLAGINLKRLPVRQRMPMPAPGVLPSPVETANAEWSADAIAASHQGLFDLDFDQGLVTLSGDAAVLAGISDGETTEHRAWEGRVHPDDRPTYASALAEYRARPGLAFRLEFRIQDDHDYRWLELRATMMGEGDRAKRCVGLIADVTARKEAEAGASDRPLVDELTGLGNRLALMETLEQAVLADFLFALIDIDRFKSIHSSLGDEGGDRILSLIAERLRRRFENKATLYRTGGDAFAALVPASGEDAEKLGQELAECINASAFRVGGRNVFAQASVGVARGAESEDPLDLIKDAELALIKAKRQGGNTAVTFQRGLDVAPDDSVTIDAELREALAEKQLEVLYQPIMRLADGSLAGFEAVLRWNHPRRGLVTPDAFITYAEQTGLILPIGRFALARATRELAHWQRFFPLTPPLFVSVNVSRRQLNDPELEKDVADVLGRGEIRRGSLKLEITESVVTADSDSHGKLDRLRALGACLSIDDFGTGISNLSQLQDVPFDAVKIDKSFLRRPIGGSEGAILPSIVALAHELKREVIVEGVETDEDVRWLRELGCEFAQGFRFAAPMSADDALNYIATHFDVQAAVPDRAVPGSTR